MHPEIGFELHRTAKIVADEFAPLLAKGKSLLFNLKEWTDIEPMKLSAFW